MPGIDIPPFEPVFDGVRGDSSKHLSWRRSDGSYKVDQSIIDEFAKDLISSEFYCRPWLKGCTPETVLFPNVIEGIRSTNPLVRRKSVNQAFKAEDRIVRMGVVSFVRWCMEGRDPNVLAYEQEPEAESEPTVTPEYRVVPRRTSISLTKLSRETRDKLEKIFNNKDLLNSMNAGLRGRIKQAHRDIEDNRLHEEFGCLILEVFEEWYVAHTTEQKLKRLIPEVIEQREEMLVNYPGKATAIIHCGKLIMPENITDPNKIVKLLKEGVALMQKYSLPE